MKAVAGREEWVPHQAKQVHLLGLVDDQHHHCHHHHRNTQHCPGWLLSCKEKEVYNGGLVLSFFNGYGPSLVIFNSLNNILNILNESKENDRYSGICHTSIYF